MYQLQNYLSELQGICTKEQARLASFTASLPKIPNPLAGIVINDGANIATDARERAEEQQRQMIESVNKQVEGLMNGK